jgi:uncharacterized pyridoxamine 5'-phosphate oxidase family protein
MFDYQSILAKNHSGVFATQDGAKVETRVFGFMFSEGNRVYFCTSSAKPVYGQLMANPYASFCTYTPDFAPVLSVNGKCVFVEDMELKTRIMDENPGIKGIYQSPENPVFKVFYMEVEEVQTFSFAEGAKYYKV